MSKKTAQKDTAKNVIADISHEEWGAAGDVDTGHISAGALQRIADALELLVVNHGKRVLTQADADADLAGEPRPD